MSTKETEVPAHVSGALDREAFDRYAASIGLLGNVPAQAQAWIAVHGLCCRLGMNSQNKSGQDAVLDFIRECAALRTQEAGWRTMESAPRDGTRVLLGWANISFDNVRTAAFMHGQWHDYTRPLVDPDRWMPLPAPPQEEPR